MAVAVGTWSFSKKALEVIAEELTNGHSYIDGLEKGINGKLNIKNSSNYFIEPKTTSGRVKIHDNF